MRKDNPLSMEQAQMTGRLVEKELFIQASPERVFRALTTKEELERWFVMKAEIDLRPGGAIKFAWTPEAFEVGKILELEPPHRLSYTWETFGPGPTIVTFELAAEGAGTRLRLIHTGIGNSADWDNYYNAVNGGWNAHLADLTSWLEVGICPPPGSRG